jgi:urease accessory protein
LWCIDKLFLRGEDKNFYHSQLWAEGGILGNAFLLLPERVNLNQEQEKILTITDNSPGVRAASSILPNDKGFVVRAIASGSWGLKNYFHRLRECFREIAA